MPCIFCIAVFAMLAGAVTTAVLDQLEERLAAVAGGPVARTVDTGSVVKFEFSVPAPVVPGVSVPADVAAAVPVAVTVYKQHARIRIQILTHALPRAVAEAVEDRLAAAAGLRIVARADAHTGSPLAAPSPGGPEAAPLEVREPRRLS
jgi:hypothetical protein